MSRPFLFGAMRIVILVVALALLLSGCEGDGVEVRDVGDEGSLIGRWYSGELGQMLSFAADGTMVISGEEYVVTLTYRTEGGTIHAQMSDGERLDDMTYSVDGDILTVSSEDRSIEYVRVQ